MSLISRLSIGVTFGLLLSLSTPFIVPAISHSGGFATAQAQTQSTTFKDVPDDYWAQDYIVGLAKLNITSGFGDGTFRPDESVTRAQFAAILRKAFLQSQSTTAQPFTDVPSKYWATDAIYAARSAGFLSGYPGNRFAPNNPITREEALISLVRGLKYEEGDPTALSLYRDVDRISSYGALQGVLAAARADLIINYPDVNEIAPDRPASRADVAVFVYQALVKAGRAEALAASGIGPWRSDPLVVLPVLDSHQISLSRTGQQLATVADGSNSFQVWNAQTGQLIKEIPAFDQTFFSSTVISHDGKRVAAVSINQSTDAATLSMWTVTTGELLWQTSLDTLQPPGYWPVQVVFTPDDSEVASQLVASTPASRNANNQLRFYQAATGEVVQSSDTAIANDAVINKIVFSPNGQLFASARRDVVDVWQRNGKNQFELLKTLPVPEDASRLPSIVFADNNTLNVLNVTDDVRFDGQLDTWNVQTDSQPNRIEPIEAESSDTISSLSPDGKYYFVRSVLTGSRMYNLQTRSKQTPPGGGGYYYTAAAFSEDGNYFAIASEQGIFVSAQETTSNL